MLKKLRSKAGLTIVEMMVTLVLLSLFSSACLVGITSAFASRRDHIRIGDADILKSTITEVITQELRMCDDPKLIAPNRIQYKGGLRIDGYLGNMSELSLTEEDSEKKIKEGRLQKKLLGLSGVTEDGTFTYSVLNEAAYLNETANSEKGFFKIDGLTFTIDETDKTISVKFKIVDDDGTAYAEADFTVVPLNWH